MSILNLLGRLYSGKKIYGNIPNKLLLIDEVDLGLHPEWQRLWISDVLPLISEILCSDVNKVPSKSLNTALYISYSKFNFINVTFV